MIVKGKSYINGELKEVSIKIVNGIIEEVKKEITAEGEEVLDFRKRGCVILPSFIDIHVHLRDFDYSYKEDFYSGTCAAAAGGFAIVLDMPNTKPFVNTIYLLKYRDEVARNKAVVDYGLLYGLPKNSGELEQYERYAVGMKIYPEDMYSGEKDILNDALNYNEKKGILTIVHPENPLYFVNDERPLKAEIRAAEDVALISLNFKCPFHLTHISSVHTVNKAKTINSKLTVDTCPHYLFLSSERVHNQPYYKVYPPLRSEENRKELLNAFINGQIDILATDHAPHAYDEKIANEPKSGFPGLETALPLVFTLFKKGLISLERIVKVCVLNPAKLIGISGKVGLIKTGYIGNLTVVDLSSEYKIDAYKFYSKAKHSPFHGWKVFGKIVATIVRGETVFHEGIVANPGYGRNIKEAYF
ncbi:MAG: dihydroorotase family protein [Candidatus Geothermarchaeota archaeon]